MCSGMYAVRRQRQEVYGFENIPGYQGKCYLSKTNSNTTPNQNIVLGEKSHTLILEYTEL